MIGYYFSHASARSIRIAPRLGPWLPFDQPEQPPQSPGEPCDARSGGLYPLWISHVNFDRFEWQGSTWLRLSGPQALNWLAVGWIEGKLFCFFPAPLLCGERAWDSSHSLKCCSIFLITSAWSMKLIMRISPGHRGQISGSVTLNFLDQIGPALFLFLR
jgi:hypothetical protein